MSEQLHAIGSSTPIETILCPFKTNNTLEFLVCKVNGREMLGLSLGRGTANTA
jgi:hypothetical protein